MSRLELANVDTPELWTARERGFFALTDIIVAAQQNGWAAGRAPLSGLAGRVRPPTTAPISERPSEGWSTTCSTALTARRECNDQTKSK